MKLSTRLWILLGPQLYKYSRDVDYFIGKRIENGKILGLTNNEYFVFVEYKGHYYKLWITNRWYADLTSAYRTDADGNMYERMYKNIRPSRRVKLKFWEWLESNGIHMRKADKEDERLNRLRDMFVCA